MSHGGMINTSIPMCGRLGPGKRNQNAFRHCSESICVSFILNSKSLRSCKGAHIHVALLRFRAMLYTDKEFRALTRL